MDHAQPPERQASPHRMLTRRRSIAGAMLAVLLVLFAVEHEPYLRALNEANSAMAQAIENVTPGGLAGQIQARQAQCTYQWLVVCEKRVESRRVESVADGFSRIDDSGVGYDYDTSYLGAAWRTLGDVAQLPDASWAVLRESTGKGVLTLAMTILFFAISILVARRFPILTWPLALPLAGFISSGLFWAVKEILLGASDGFGLAIEGLLCLTLVPSAALWLFEWLRAGHDMQAIAHKAAELKASLNPPT